MQLLYIYLHFPINKNSTIHVGKTYHNPGWYGICNLFRSTRNYWLKNVDCMVATNESFQVLFFPIGVLHSGSFMKFHLLGSLSAGDWLQWWVCTWSTWWFFVGQWWFLLWSDFCYAVMMSCLFIIHKKNQKIYLLECAMAFLGLIMSCVRDIFGPWDVSWLRFSGTKKRKKWRRLRDRNVGCETVVDPRCVETPPGDHSPAKKQFPPWTGWKTRCKKKTWRPCTSI